MLLLVLVLFSFAVSFPSEPTSIVTPEIAPAFAREPFTVSPASPPPARSSPVISPIIVTMPMAGFFPKANSESVAVIVAEKSSPAEIAPKLPARKMPLIPRPAAISPTAPLMRSTSVIPPLADKSASVAPSITPAEITPPPLRPLFALMVSRYRRIVFITGGTYVAKVREFLDSVDNVKLLKPFTLDRVHAALDTAALR